MLSKIDRRSDTASEMAEHLALSRSQTVQGTYVIAHLYAAKAYLKESMSHLLRLKQWGVFLSENPEIANKKKNSIELSQRKLVCHWRWKAPGFARGVGGIAKGTMWAVLLWLKLIGFPWCPLLATCGAVTLNALIYDRIIRPSTEKVTSLKKPY